QQGGNRLALPQRQPERAVGVPDRRRRQDRRPLGQRGDPSRGRAFAAATASDRQGVGFAAMARGAAFFDLDRTLLRKASGPVLTEALVHAGIAPDRQIPGMTLVYRVNDVFGESAAAMGLARLAANVAKGWRP